MSRRHEHDDRGATAVLVAVLALVLIGISGFTIDLGSAYVSKRNLQKASDAGALAAAQVLTQYAGDCPTVRDNSAAFAEAHAAAQRFGELNYDGTKTQYESTELEFDIDCDRTPGVLIVKYGLAGDTDTSTSRLLEAPDTITTQRRAEATVDVAPGAGESVRPLALCSAQVQVVPRPSTYPFVRVDAPKNATKLPTTCPAKTGSGNWWVVDCPDEAPGESTEEQIEFGCDNPVSVIPGQEDDLTPGELTLAIGGECAPKDDDENCLSGDTGNIDSGHTADKWEILVRNQETAIFPVFCAVPQCDASTIEGSGTNAVYPVFKMVAAVICGFHFSKTERYVSTTGECAGMPSMYTSDEWEAGNDVNFMLLKYVNERTSASNEDSECALGAECDGLLRRSRLTGGGE
ncbi:pilus assembly protein TadG-related protein [Nocardioides ganghwensis]|uniref:Putative Flp pilus-assembly TadG-like N-terminal domain-containing protein n=1 Tax=Nocardioides ganghwensis TaxID=252230 RepID=A0A4Q2SAV6_9ACTN|nr:pilus assembly protein TadG-related protein [Nocardioides ganghwensis]MBD3946988.1 hypothetical protein [Nocardioides ganghwensis]RYC01909.1 hypothetical protein EUA07_10115 [Nocardioides ganghwensis]